MFKYLTLGFAVIAVVLAQRRPQSQSQIATTPVPILRQINTHNQDGSYTYGYESADGSYKIENKAATGDVKGKYGYYDDAGQLREIEYGATRDGFNPSGTGINVPPHVPAIRKINAAGADYDDDGQYRPAEHQYPYDYEPEQNLVQAPRQGARGLNFPRRQQQPQQQQQQFEDNTYYQPSEYVQPAPTRQQYQPARAAAVNHVDPYRFNGHPASNINLASGSYSVNY